MDNEHEAMEWLAQRIVRTLDKMLKLVTDEAKFELMGLPLRMTQLIHNSAIFELLRIINAPPTNTGEPDADNQKFVKSLLQARADFFALCERLAQGNPGLQDFEARTDNPLPFKRNASRN